MLQTYVETEYCCLSTRTVVTDVYILGIGTSGCQYSWVKSPLHRMVCYLHLFTYFIDILFCVLKSSLDYLQL